MIACVVMTMADHKLRCCRHLRRALEQVPFAALSDSFDFDLEVIASARARGLRVGEAPVPTHYGDEESHLQPVAYGLRGARFYRHAVLTGGSCAIAALAAVWFVERSLGLTILTIR